MINKKKLREVLEKYLVYEVSKGYDPSDIRGRITIKRKNKPMLLKTSNGTKYKRVSYINIEIIE